MDLIISFDLESDPGRGALDLAVSMAVWAVSMAVWATGAVSMAVWAMAVRGRLDGCAVIARQAHLVQQKSTSENSSKMTPGPLGEDPASLDP